MLLNLVMDSRNSIRNNLGKNFVIRIVNSFNVIIKS